MAAVSLTWKITTPLLSPYPLQELDEYSYEFFTDHGLRYVIYFVDYSAQFADYPVLIGRVFMFNMEVVAGDPTTSPKDERIALTVRSVFRAFFLREHNVIVYVCDGLDHRHQARKRESLRAGLAGIMMARC